MARALTQDKKRPDRPGFRPFPGVIRYLRGLVRSNLELEVGGRRHAFASIEDLSEFLEPRTTLPADRIEALRDLPGEQLDRQSQDIRSLERTLSELLVHAIEDSTSVAGLIRRLGLGRFSKDHEWRAIVEQLAAAGGAFDEHRKLAVAKYLQYLAARKQALKAIYEERRLQWREGEGTRNEQVEPALQETGVFDATMLARVRRAAKPEPEFERVPIGETVKLVRDDPGPVALRLATHRFTLETGGLCRLVDEFGNAYELRRGRNVIGRHLDNDVVVDGRLRGVSRVHVMIEVVEGDSVRLTDFSSQGTFAACPFESVTSRRKHRPEIP